MLRFIFSILIVLLDQLFKRWIVLTLEVGQEAPLINGLISLFHLENTGAAFNFLADQRWLLAGIQLLAALVLIAILLRYTDGFWGTLGLAAVLGGTVGNLIDRVFLGYVVDMFRFEFVDFAIFNFADVFITLGFLTFLVHYIVSALRPEKTLDHVYSDLPTEVTHDTADYPVNEDIPDPEPLFSQDAQIWFDSNQSPMQEDIPPHDFGFQPSSSSFPVFPDGQQEAMIDSPVTIDSPVSDDTSPILDVLSALEEELAHPDMLVDYDVDKLLSEYGFESDNN